MTEPREYLVRTPEGHDYGRDASEIGCQLAAADLGPGATVIALDEFLLPMRDADGNEVVVHTVEEAKQSAPCPYRTCSYQATDVDDLDEHLLAMPTDAPEHTLEDDDLPRRTPGMFSRR